MIRVTVRGDKKLFEAIDRLAETISDQRERGWQDNVDVRLDSERRFLDTEGAGGWVPLNVDYAREKEEAVGNVPILQYTNRMYRSLTEEGAPNYVREEGSSSLKVGSSDPKARYHQEGRGRLPVREVMRATNEEGQEQLHVFHDSYSEIAKALGFRVL